jgi:hypothetical protein
MPLCPQRSRDIVCYPSLERFLDLKNLSLKKAFEAAFGFDMIPAAEPPK